MPLPPTSLQSLKMKSLPKRKRTENDQVLRDFHYVHFSSTFLNPNFNKTRKLIQKLIFIKQARF